MSTVSDCVRRQRELHGLISRAATNAKKAGTDQRTSHHLRARLNTLERNWERFQTQHNLLPTTGEKGSDVATYISEDLRSTCEEAYISSYAALQKELQEVSKTEASTSKEEPTGSSASHSQRLPRLDLPKFSGEYNEWISFRDLFTVMVVSNSSIPNVEKLQYLKMCLSGEASLLIAGVAVTEENFESAWKVVTDRYENKRVLVDIQLDSLFSLKRLTAESGVELKRLHNTVRDVTGALTNLGCAVKEWDPILVYWVTRRMDLESLRAWQFTLGNASTLPSFATLETFLRDRVRALESVERLVPSTSGQSKQRVQ